MSSFVETRQKAIALVEQLSPDKLTAVIQLLELLTESSKDLTLSDQESRLLTLIQRV